MSIEIAYLAERTVEVLKSLVSKFFPEVLSARDGDADGDSSARKRAIPPGTRILISSPSLGRKDTLQEAMKKMKDVLDMAKTFSEEKDRILGTGYVNMFRGFLMSLASVTEAGAARNRPILEVFLECLKACTGQTSPAQVKSDAKKSWADFLQAVQKKDDARPPCKDIQSRLAALLKSASASLQAEAPAHRQDSENLISAAENLLEACKNCVFRKDMRT